MSYIVYNDRTDEEHFLDTIDEVFEYVENAISVGSALAENLSVFQEIELQYEIKVSLKS